MNPLLQQHERPITFGTERHDAMMVVQNNNNNNNHGTATNLDEDFINKFL